MTDVRVHFRINVSAITRMLPRHLRELFKRDVTERLLARRGERVSVDDIRAIAAGCCAGRERNERHYHRGLRGRVRLTLGVLLTHLWPWVRKRPNAPKGNDDMTGGSRSAYGLV